MHLQDIYIYPIKSLGGIRLSEAEVQTAGLAHDRRWMVVDDNGHFLTQRAHPQMALLQVEMVGDGLKIYHKRQSALKHLAPLKPETDDFIPVTVWNDTVMAQVVSKSSNRWFTEFLGLPCKLVFMPSSTERHIAQKYAVNNETVSFADAMPYLLIGQSSLDDLNEKLATALPMNRFRPNFVFTGGSSFDEDQWEEVSIGKCLFKVTKPSARCVMITIDQDTATATKEPLKTLAGYRSFDKKILFGQNLISLTAGVVSVGNRILPVYKPLLKD